jgi:23S rRNA (cytidine1920-2'-O)/16S rRNA (cytidine1409-2'-O)-methyltransferase
MVRRGLVRSRSEARRLIQAGRVMLGGDRSPKPSSLVSESSSIEVIGLDRFVGRGGDKLAAALDRFGVNPNGRKALDIGASVGGFTDCLLRRGAELVVSVDVGHGQLSNDLVNHPAVRSLEGTDIRNVEFETIGGPFDLVVVDLSFISLCAVTAALTSATNSGGDVIALIKPQFEVGSDRIGRGIVTDSSLQDEAVAKVKDCFAGAGLDSVDLMTSPITGEHGNQEYFLWARKATAVRTRRA